MSRPTWFEENVRKALADDAARAAINHAAIKKIDARAAAVAEVDNFEKLRDLARDIKQHTVENLDRYLDQFIAKVESLGGKVHLAETAADANRTIAGIARDNDLKLAVKVKSMTSEETGLNAALEAVGLRVVETDLGEFIVQLDHDRPSHIVTPIIHKNRKVIAEAFARELGVEYTEDAETLTMHARRHLRDIFRRCDLGVSGVNFAVAETGAICICTNEGNGRLSTTRPKVHVALMGIEKVIPRMADLAVFLKILARSSTGQPITVYTSLINGPKRPADPDGPEQLHVVILDGGRRAIQRSEYSEVLRCIRCGACLNACPVFRRLGGHAYGNVYPGPIGELLAPLLNDKDHYADLPQASSLCGLCLEVCPVRIDIPDVLVRLRKDQVRDHAVPRMRRLAFRWMFSALSSPWMYRLSQKLARLGTAPWADGEWNRKLPGPTKRFTEFRDTPRPAAKPFRQLWKQEQNRERQRPDQEQNRERQRPARRQNRERVQGMNSEDTTRLPAIEDALVRRVGPGDDLVAIFCKQARNVGLNVAESSSETVVADLAKLIQSIQPEGNNDKPRVIIEPSLFLREQLEAALSGDAELLNLRDGDDAMFSADVGVTGVHAAIAESGSIICASGEQRWRGLSLIPPAHIAIVPESQIVPDLLDFFASLPGGKLPANLTLISGPSKTADIEGILITGVHGPGRVQVVVVRDEP